MSKLDIESAKHNTDRIKSDIQELLQMVVSQKEAFDGYILEFESLLTSLIEDIAENNEEIAESEKRSDELSKESEELANAINNLTKKRELLSTKNIQKNTDLTRRREEKLKLEAEKSNLEAQIRTKKEVINNKEEEIKLLEERINETKQNTESIKKQKKEQLEKYKTEYIQIVSKAKALLYLLKKDVISLPEVKVIRTLNRPGLDDETNIVKTAGVSHDLVRRVLLDLDEREIISFDPLSKKIEVKMDLDL